MGLAAHCSFAVDMHLAQGCEGHASLGMEPTGRCRHALPALDTHAHNAAMSLQIITPYNMYFNAWLLLQKLELWRLFTNFFFFFGSLGAPQPLDADA